MGIICYKQSKKSTLSKTHFSTRLEDVFDVYTVSRVIGFGSYGVIRMGFNKINPNLTVAIKSIDKSRLKNASHLEYLRSEVSALMSVDHPNIIKLYETFENSRFFHLVTEYCSGGELFTRIVDIGSYTEQDASRHFKAILRAIHCLHLKGICHRDIKPENFVFTSKDRHADLKLIDFGMAKMTQFQGRMHTVVGTPYFAAPEIFRGEEYGLKCDMWSAGVVLYMMLSGDYPFKGEKNSVIQENVTSLPLRMENWNHISEDAKDLVSRLLVRDPKERLDADTALKHPWFRRSERFEGSLDYARIFESLQQYNNNTGFCKEAMQVALRYVSDSDLKELKEIFLKIDIDQSGYLSWDEIQAACNITEKDARRMIGHFKSSNQQINYSEFLAATLVCKVRLHEDIIWSAFKHFDLDNSGFITVSNLKNALAISGKNIESQSVKNIIREIDLKKLKGKISFEQFKKMLIGQ